MTIRIGQFEFDHVDYDAESDVLYLGAGAPRPAGDGDATPEGHAIRYDENGRIIGITLVNAKWLLERDGRLTITIPDKVAIEAEELAPALTPA